PRLYLLPPLSFEGLRLRPDFVLDLVFADFLLEPDDPFLELLFLREIVFRHLAELLLEPAFQLFTGSSALAGRHGCEALLFRLERRLALHEVQLPLLHLALVRLHLPEAGLELFAQLLVHGPLLADVGLDGLTGLRPQLAHFVIGDPFGRSPGRLRAAAGGRNADPVLERRIFAGQPLPERVILRIAPRDGGTDPRIQSTVRIALEPGGGAFVVRL